MHLAIFNFGPRPNFLKNLNFTFELSDPSASEIFIPSKSKVIIILPEKNIAGAKKLCQRLRNQEISLPVIIVGKKIPPEQVKNFLKSGADDCLRGDWKLIELQARLKALIRRPEIFINSPLKIKNLKIDFFKRCAQTNKKDLLLTPREFDILEYLSKNQDRLVNREELSLELWDNDFDSPSLTVNSHLYNLRAKLKNSGATAKIVTVSGGGYLLK